MFHILTESGSFSVVLRHSSFHVTFGTVTFLVDVWGYGCLTSTWAPCGAPACTPAGAPRSSTAGLGRGSRVGPGQVEGWRRHLAVADGLVDLLAGGSRARPGPALALALTLALGAHRLGQHLWGSRRGRVGNLCWSRGSHHLCSRRAGRRIGSKP